jgi:hypothetical protein
MAQFRKDTDSHRRLRLTERNDLWSAKIPYPHKQSLCTFRWTWRNGSGRRKCRLQFRTTSMDLLRLMRCPGEM